jgi:type IV secretory pathway component VirB8
MLLVLEDKLGLAELHRDALDSFIETIFTDPQKILQVQDLDNRVRNLEKQTNRLWIAVGIAGGLLAVLITSVAAMALAS